MCCNHLIFIIIGHAGHLEDEVVEVELLVIDVGFLLGWIPHPIQDYLAEVGEVDQVFPRSDFLHKGAFFTLTAIFFVCTVFRLQNAL